MLNRAGGQRRGGRAKGVGRRTVPERLDDGGEEGRHAGEGAVEAEVDDAADVYLPVFEGEVYVFCGTGVSEGVEKRRGYGPWFSVPATSELVPRLTRCTASSRSGPSLRNCGGVSQVEDSREKARLCSLGPVGEEEQCEEAEEKRGDAFYDEEELCGVSGRDCGGDGGNQTFQLCPARGPGRSASWIAKATMPPNAPATAAKPNQYPMRSPRSAFV